VDLFVGRPFWAVVATKNVRFRRPEKGVLHFLLLGPATNAATQGARQVKTHVAIAKKST
jgi:hypothetical protein